MTEEFPGWETDALGGLTLTVTIGGEEIRRDAKNPRVEVTEAPRRGALSYLATPQDVPLYRRRHERPSDRRGDGPPARHR